MTSSIERPSASTTGFIWAGFLCLALIPWTMLVSGVSVFFGFAESACVSGCNYDVLSAGENIARLGPIVVCVIAIVLTIVHAVRRRRFSWVFPLAGFVATIIAFYVGDFIATAPNNLPLV